MAGRQSLGLQAGERQGLRLTFSADEDTALTLTPTQRLTPQTPALDSPAPQSPTLQRLQAELAEKRPGALKAFWKQVAKQGTPLVEPLDAERVLVTFLWRQQRPGDVRLLWPTPEVNTRRFEALAGSDVRYLSLPLRRDARVSYQLSADLPDLQQADRGTLRLALQAAAAGPAEPYAVAQQPRAAAGRAGLAGLGGAPAETWDQPRKDVPRGKVERLGYSSQALANQRQLTLYTPPGYDPEGQRYPLLVLFDEDHYARDVPTPTILDNLIAAGRIRPTLAVIVGNVDASSRGRELPCNEAFADMLAHELLPWLQQRYALSEEPADRVLSGSSYGGLASGCIAYRYPERFGKVLSLSGSFWWGRTSSSRSGWYGSSPLASVCRWCSSSVPACSRSPRRTAFSAATAACARRCKARATRCTTASSPAVTTTRRGAWSLPKGCRPCCRRIEPAGWRGADSCLRLSCGLEVGKAVRSVFAMPTALRNRKNRPGPFASVGG